MGEYGAAWHVLPELSCVSWNCTKCMTMLQAPCGCYQSGGETCILLTLQVVKSPCYWASLLWHPKTCHQSAFCGDVVVWSGTTGGLPQLSVKTKAWWGLASVVGESWQHLPHSEHWALTCSAFLLEQNGRVGFLSHTCATLLRLWMALYKIDNDVSLLQRVSKLN